jgi:hypothetical protein
MDRNQHLNDSSDDTKREALRLLYWYHRTSVYEGDTWLAYRPGEDAWFKNDWVSRGHDGEMRTVVRVRKELIKNAAHNRARLVWQKKNSSEGSE